MEKSIKFIALNKCIFPTIEKVERFIIFLLYLYSTLLGPLELKFLLTLTIFVSIIVKSRIIALKKKQYTYLSPILSQRLWKIAFIITILTSNSSSICLMLFQTQIYMNFINTIESIRIRLYQISKHSSIDSILSSTRGNSSLPNRTLKVFNPQTNVPYTPAFFNEKKRLEN